MNETLKKIHEYLMERGVEEKQEREEASPDSGRVGFGL